MSATDAVYRTPEERFAGLPDFDFEPRYAEVDGLRLGYVDEGEGPPVVFFHGNPTWSYLWRRVIPPVRDAGYRCVAPDLVGFGRSDKPTELDWYTYDRHVDLMARLVEDLDIRDATAVVHDWGGPIGLRVAVEHPDRFGRLVVTDTGLFTGTQPVSDTWRTFRDFVEQTEDLPISMLVKSVCRRGLADDVAAAYDAPFPTPASKAGARALPLILPTSPDMPGAEEGRRTRDALEASPWPKLVLWGDSDPILPFKVGEALARVLGSDPPTPIPDASHFLQEDAGGEVGRRIADWLSSLR